MKTKKRIVFLINDMSSGGAQRVVANVAEYWLGEQHDIFILTLASKDLDFYKLNSKIGRYSIEGESVSSNKFVGLLNNFKLIFKIRRSIKIIQPDLVISFVAPMNILSVISLMGMKSKLIISERNDPLQQSFGIIRDFLRRLLYKYAYLITANTKHAVTVMSDFVPQKKLKYIPNPIHITYDESKTSRKGNVLLAVGRLHHQKAYDILLHAFADVKNNNDSLTDWKLYIIGEGELKSNLAELAESLGIAESVNWLGRIQDVNDWYLKADIFVQPSRYEGMSNSLMEAMQAKLPVIVSDRCFGAKDFVVDSTHGLYFESENVNDLSDKIYDLMSDEELRGRLGGGALSEISKFSFKNCMLLWNEIID